MVDYLGKRRWFSVGDGREPLCGWVSNERETLELDSAHAEVQSLVEEDDAVLRREHGSDCAPRCRRAHHDRSGGLVVLNGDHLDVVVLRRRVEAVEEASVIDDGKTRVGRELEV